MRSLALTQLVLAAASGCMTVAAIVYGVVTVGVPYPEPTPAQAASERHHMHVLEWLMFGTGFCWLVTILMAVVSGTVWTRRSKRDRLEGDR